MILRKTWEDECAVLGWDQSLPKEITKEITELFKDLFNLEKLSFPRSLWPPGKVLGNPELIVFSDGSVITFESVIYIRWRLTQEEWWTQLVCSKGKLGPKN